MLKTFNSKILKISVISALCFSFLFSFCSFESKCEGIRESVLRLHILANSDSDEDQTLKLKVRDSLLQNAGEIFDSVTNKEVAIQSAQKKLVELQQTAQNTVVQNGCDYTVSVELGKAYFDTRVYGESTFPAGIYDALIVRIGESQGKNWWCVMFPPLCISAASEEVDVSEVLSDEQQKIVEGGERYRVKFWCVEKFWQIKRKLAEIF